MKIEHMHNVAGNSIAIASPGKERMLELSCPAVNVSQLLDMRMPAVVLNDPKMERRIRIDNHVVDQLEQVAETCISLPGQKRGNITLIVELVMAS